MILMAGASSVPAIFFNGNTVLGPSSAPIDTQYPAYSASLGKLVWTTPSGGGGVAWGQITGSLSNQADLGVLAGLNSVNLSGSQATGILAAARFPALTGDLTTPSGAISTTLATVNANVGSFGGASSVPSLTVNAKGLVTAASATAVIAPAGTLTGATLATNVLASSLTSVGTIATGTWSGLFGVVTGANLTHLTAANIDAGTAAINVSGNAATVTTNANLTGVVASIGNATSIANGAISNSMLANPAVANLSGTNTGDQNLSGYALLSGATFTGPISGGNILQVRNGINAQEFQVYETSTDSTHYGRFVVRTTAGNYTIGSEQGSGGGTARGLVLQTAGVAALNIDTSQNLNVMSNTGQLVFPAVAGTKIALFGFGSTLYNIALTSGIGMDFTADGFGFRKNAGNQGTDIKIWGSISFRNTPVTVNGSTSGTATFDQPYAGQSLKRVIIYCTALLGTASYTFPTPFLFTPQVLSQALAAVVTSISTTAVTLTGTTSTGFIELSGY